MWGKKRKRKVTKIDTLIDKRAEVTGNINFSGGMHIDGTVRGNIIGKADGRSLLSLSEIGTIEGEINVPHLVLNGAVIGSVYSSEHLELAPKARIEGNIYYNLLEVSTCAQINGQLIHTPNTVQEEPGLADDAADRAADGDNAGEETS